MFRQISDVLADVMADLREGMDDEGRNAILDPGKGQDAARGDIIRMRKTAGAEAPAKSARTGGIARGMLVVIDGCAASKAKMDGAAPRRRAAHLSIVTENGELVHSAASN